MKVWIIQTIDSPEPWFYKGFERNGTAAEKICNFTSKMENAIWFVREQDAKRIIGMSLNEERHKAVEHEVGTGPEYCTCAFPDGSRVHHSESERECTLCGKPTISSNAKAEGGEG